MDPWTWVHGSSLLSAGSDPHSTWSHGLTHLEPLLSAQDQPFDSSILSPRVHSSTMQLHPQSPYSTQLDFGLDLSYTSHMESAAPSSQTPELPVSPGSDSGLSSTATNQGRHHSQSYSPPAQPQQRPHRCKGRRQHKDVEAKYRRKLRECIHLLAAKVPVLEGESSNGNIHAKAPTKTDVLLTAIEYIDQLKQDNDNARRRIRALQSELVRTRTLSSRGDFPC